MAESAVCCMHEPEAAWSASWTCTRTLGVGKVDHSVIHEDVDLFNSGNCVNA